MVKRALGFTILGAAALAACEGDGLGPQSGPLRLEASIGQSSLRTLDTTSIVFRVRNVGSDTIRLQFGNTCQTLSYILTYDNNPVMPSGGDWGCRAMGTSLTLPPGGADTTAIVVRACASYQGPVFLQNRYKAYARFVHPDYQMVSRLVEFRVDCG